MRTRDELGPERLRGGYYTPGRMADLAVARVAALATDGPLRVLEPSAGDGAFIRALDGHALRERVAELRAVELLESEAGKCSAELARTALPGGVHCGDFLDWATDAGPSFDVAVGNPPYLAFQFAGPRARAAAETYARAVGLPARGVSNLWIPVLLAALDRLRDGGCFAFVVPTELFTGVAAAVARAWLLRYASRLTFDIVAAGSFPGVLQQVAVLSGVRGAGGTSITVVDHDDGSRRWTHGVDGSARTWTRYLLDPPELDAYEQAEQARPARLASVARFQVAAVTGANAYFSVDADTVDEYGLGPWAVPLLPRIRKARGLVYGAPDHEELRRGGARAYLLDFSSDRPDPARSRLPAAYLALGRNRGLHLRYKCRTREPWYRVPYVHAGTLMLSKRSHVYPRVVRNPHGVVTTDTIYRGAPTVPSRVSADDVAAAFHNSATLLSAEIEGRSFGGGVLELVPSEVNNLLLPAVRGFGAHLGRLDRLARQEGEQSGALVHETNALLAKEEGDLDLCLLDVLERGRARLAARRLDRNAGDHAGC